MQKGYTRMRTNSLIHRALDRAQSLLLSRQMSCLRACTMAIEDLGAQEELNADGLASALYAQLQAQISPPMGG